MKKIIFFLFVAILGVGITNQVTAKKQFTPRTGQPAPDIQLEDPNGEVLKLSDLKGHIVLIDFWASWCGPCRKKNPEIVALYEKYSNEKFAKGVKGFTVYNVSLDNNLKRWQDAIAIDKLNWKYHVSDLKGWSSSAAAKYGVKSIPSTFLINEQGDIIGVNLSTQAISFEIDKRLKTAKN
jgi:thiol-disulfide isomerase/thioredoxin